MTIRLDAGNLTQTRSDLGLAIGTDVLAPNGSAASLTAIPAAQITGTLPAVNGGSITDLNATNLGSGTVPDARFPATLPAASAANLTSIPAGNLTGSVADARLPANLQSFPAPGSDGNVLTAAAGARTSAAAAGGGAWAVKTSGTFSSTTALEVTNITKTTIVYFTAISQTQNSVGLRTSSDNGSSYDATGGDYNQYGAYSTNSALSNVAFAGSFTSMFLQGSNAPDAAGFLAGWFMLVQPADTNTKTIVLSMCCSEDAGTTGQQFYNMAGVRDTAAAVNAIKMFHPGVTSSFTSGSFVVCELN